MDLDTKEGWDEFKQHSAHTSSERITGYDMRYSIRSKIAGKSFRSLSKEDKKRIEEGLLQGISQIDKRRINMIYNERIAVQIELFLIPSYLKKVDIDNVAKTVIDLLNKKTWKDDKQIMSLNVIKISSNRGGIVIKIGRFIGYTHRFG